MFDGSKKGTNGSNEGGAVLAFERFNEREELAETILKPSFAARAARFASTAGSVLWSGAAE